MAKTTFQGPVVSKKGFFNTGPGNVVDADSSVSLTVDTHAGRIVHNDAAGAVTYTLPATNANSDSAVAGPGADLNNLSNVGASFEIFASITKTGDFVVQVANANATFTTKAYAAANSYVNSNFVKADATNISFSGQSVTISGNLIVQGTTTQTTTSSSNVESTFMILNAGLTLSLIHI